MNTALCISGHIRNVHHNIENQNKCLIEPNDCDVFVYTSTMNTQVLGPGTNIKRRNVYMHKDVTGLAYDQKHSKGRGLKYVLKEDYVKKEVEQAYGERLKELVVQDQTEWDKQNLPQMYINSKQKHVKWEYYRLRGYKKVQKCNILRKEYEAKNNINYDFVIRSRTDIQFNRKINIEEHIRKVPYSKLQETVFIPGGWADPRGFTKNKIGIFADFAFGVPSVMDIFSNLCDVTKIYENGGAPDLENPGNQLEQYLQEKGVAIAYIRGQNHKGSPVNDKRHRVYRITR